MYEKYQKKITTFRSELKKNCFLRYVYNCEELNYILNYEKYIDKVIKKENEESEILFLIEDGIEIPNSMKFRYYIVKYRKNMTTFDALRSIFDINEELIKYCVRNYDAYTMIKNIEFDYKKREENNVKLSCRYNSIVKILNAKFDKMSFDKELVIYGAGNVGKTFYKMVKNKCKVKCFVDQQLAGRYVDDLPVVWLDKLEDIEKCQFIITVAYDYQNIYKVIKNYFENVEIKLLDEVLN